MYIYIYIYIYSMCSIRSTQIWHIYIYICHKYYIDIPPLFKHSATDATCPLHDVGFMVLQCESDVMQWASCIRVLSYSTDARTQICIKYMYVLLCIPDMRHMYKYIYVTYTYICIYIYMQTYICIHIGTEETNFSIHRYKYTNVYEFMYILV